MSHTIKALVLIIVLHFQPAAGWTAEPVLMLDRLIEEALAANPQIETARQRAAAARQQVPQAGALEDPMLGFGVLNVPDNFDLDAEDMTSKEITLSQQVPFIGKRRLRREAAEQMAEAAREESSDTANQVIREVKLAFFDLSHVHRATQVTRRNKTILEDFSRLAQTRYSVGEGIQEDVIRVQVDISRMVDELLMLDQRRRALEARLNMLRNRPSEEPLGAPEELPFQARTIDVERLQQAAMRTSPMLNALARETDSREKEFLLAGRERFPDFNLRFSYGQREDRRDMYSAMVEMNLPVFARSKQNRQVDEAAAELSGQKARLTSARNELFFTIADLGAMAGRLERQVELYRTGIIPQTTMQIQSAMSAYTVNKADFMTLLDSRMRLYRFELDYHQAVTEYAKTIAALEAALGATLESVQEYR